MTLDGTPSISVKLMPRVMSVECNYAGKSEASIANLTN